MNEQQFEQAIKALSPDILPERDLWLELEPRLQPQPLVRRRIWPWAAAAVLGVILFSSWQLSLHDQASAPLMVQHTMSAEQQLILVYEQQKASQLQTMVTVAEGYENWQQQLQVWEQAVVQVRNALAFYPEEPQLLAQLQLLYQQQLTYIRQAVL